MCDGSYHVIPPESIDIDLNEFKLRIKALGLNYHRSSHFLRFSDGKYEISIFKGGRMLVRGANSEKEAKNIFTRYLGV